jgi:hypothetical protein
MITDERLKELTHNTEVSRGFREMAQELLTIREADRQLAITVDVVLRDYEKGAHEMAATLQRALTAHRTALAV